MALTVGELREMLEGFDQDAEVRLMTQSNWPFENAVQGLASSADFAEGEEGEGRFEPAGEHRAEEVVYLVEGNQIGYGSKAAWANGVLRETW